MRWRIPVAMQQNMKENNAKLVFFKTKNLRIENFVYIKNIKKLDVKMALYFSSASRKQLKYTRIQFVSAFP